ncbi:peptidoglycan DD-metalloendopeptidase family protein [Streptomyces sp. 8N616]|uniref:peptidoglycan DD-metalloendopeptidase family protein n=1 Tax=Streptomyces sp. 8N616 TaxID=3457414 RepID=UPI003FD028DD
MTPNAKLIELRTFRRLMRARPVLARGGVVLVCLGVALLIVVPDRTVRTLLGLGAVFTGLFFCTAGFGLLFLPMGPRRDSRVTGAPVAGRWMVVNSPGSAVPSHGIHSLAQTFAVDLVHVPEGVPGRGEPAEKGLIAPGRFPSFGRPVYAPADGEVVAVHDSERDHRARTGPLGLACMFAEAMIREAGGARMLFGNHIVLDVGDGAYAVLAHLRKGTVTVRAGDAVRSGEQVAECGNSGNSSEPHIHFQLMDHPRASRAIGIPFAFADIGVEDGRGTCVPANDKTLVAREPQAGCG